MSSSPSSSVLPPDIEAGTATATTAATAATAAATETTTTTDITDETDADATGGAVDDTTATSTGTSNCSSAGEVATCDVDVEVALLERPTKNAIIPDTNNTGADDESGFVHVDGPGKTPATPASAMIDGVDAGGSTSASLSNAAANAKHATVLPLLPTPSSVSEGRTEAAALLCEQIREIQAEYETQTPAKYLLDDDANNADADAEPIGKIADFTVAVAPAVLPAVFLRLRKESNEARAEAALVRAELVAARGRHEEEKRRLHRTGADLRSRNEELEGRMSSLRLDGKRNGSGSGSGSGFGFEAEGRILTSSSSVSTMSSPGAIGSRFKGLFAQRLPSQRRGWKATATGDDAGDDDADEADNAADDADNDADNYSNNNDNSNSSISISPRHSHPLQLDALEELLRQSDRRADLLEQRLQIVKESGDAVIRSLHEELSDAAEDRAQAESSMIKELAKIDSQRRNEREAHDQRVREWMAHDAQRKMEVQEYESRIQSLIHTVGQLERNRIEGEHGHEHESGHDDAGSGDAPQAEPTPDLYDSNSWDQEAEDQMHADLIRYIDSLQGGEGDNNSNWHTHTPLVQAINDTFDREYNADPKVADEMIRYYHARPELRDFTLKSEVPRMDYEILLPPNQDDTGEDIKLVSTEEIRAYFNNNNTDNDRDNDNEVELLLRASNQSLLADPLAMLTGDGDGKLVHSGSFYSTVVATLCSFKLDLRHEGEMRVSVRCELAISVPSGEEQHPYTTTQHGDNDNEANTKVDTKKSATLELARADIGIQFSPSPTSTPSGASVQYRLLGIKPTMCDYGEGTQCDRTLRSAAKALVRDLKSSNQDFLGASFLSDDGRPDVASKPRFGDRLFSRARTFSKNFKSQNSG